MTQKVISRPWHRDALRLLAAGYEVDEIAAELHYSPEAVRSAMAVVRRRLRARNRTHMVVVAAAEGLLCEPKPEPHDRRKRNLTSKDWRYIAKGFPRTKGKGATFDRDATAEKFPSVNYDADAWLDVFERRPEVFAALLGAVRGYRGGAKIIRQEMRSA